MSKYLTGEATYVDGRLDELAICCIDEPNEEMQAMGLIHETYVDKVESVIEYLKAGSTLVALFRQGGEIPVEIVTIDGVETLEVVHVGQEAERSSLRKLPPVTTEAKNLWCQRFYDAFQALSDENADMLPMSNLAYDSYAAYGHKDPVAAAREVFDSKTTGTAPA